jgi:[protein-PII] uridylyltransferase
MIVRSAAASTSGTRARQEWVVAPQFGDGPETVVLRGDLTRALAGTSDVAAALARRRGSTSRVAAATPARSVAAPEVHVVPGASRRSTVLEVRARDVPALLFVVATTVAAVGVDVVGARVDTYGADAVDVFYLRQGRRALDPPEEQAVLDAVRAAVAPPPAA